MASRQLDPENPIAGCYPVTGELAQRGYRLNKFCRTLLDAANRAALKQDEAAYLRSFGLSKEETQMVAARDWLAMIRYGASPYLIFRLSGALGVGLSGTGAQMRGETLEEFMETRAVRGAR